MTRILLVLAAVALLSYGVLPRGVSEARADSLSGANASWLCGSRWNCPATCDVGKYVDCKTTTTNGSTCTLNATLTPCGGADTCEHQTSESYSPCV